MSTYASPLAPIALFVYNRPDHTLKTLKALKNNDLADQSLLFIFSDGPKKEEDKNKVNDVRKILRSDQWCKEIKIIESEKNKGLAASIIEGVTEVVNKYKKIIVLEDDLETSHGFLRYMNDALDIYESEPSVMHVAAYFYPLKKRLPETFFLNATTCWGWGTWDRAWKFLEDDAEKLLKELNARGEVKRFQIHLNGDLYKHLIANVSGKLCTWAVKWHASVFLQNGHCLHPARSMVQNIGLDFSGVHSTEAPFLRNPELAENTEVKKIPVIENSEAVRAVNEFLQKNRPSLFTRGLNRLKMSFSKKSRLFCF